MIVVRDPLKLKEDLTSNGNTMTSIAEKTGYSKAYVSSIIAGSRNPNPDISVKICELTGKPFETYFYIQNVHKRITK